MMNKGRPWLAYAREHSEHTQRSLAEKVGVSKSLIYACERKGYTPSTAVQKKIAKEIGISLSWFSDKPA